jgi:hypothetical protein
MENWKIKFLIWMKIVLNWINLMKNWFSGGLENPGTRNGKSVPTVYNGNGTQFSVPFPLYTVGTLLPFLVPGKIIYFFCLFWHFTSRLIFISKIVWKPFFLQLGDQIFKRYFLGCSSYDFQGSKVPRFHKIAHKNVD